MAETFAEFNDMMDRESRDQSAKYQNRVLPAGVYRTVPPLSHEIIVGKKDGVKYIKFTGPATAADGTTVTLPIFFNPNKKADGLYDQMFAKAWKDIEEASGAELSIAAVLDFLAQYPVDVHLRVYKKKDGQEDNGINSIKAVRA